MKKKLPTVFVCPRCGEEAVRVTIAKDTGHATVLCALCNLKDDFPAHPAAQAIDVYSYFTDQFYGVKDPRAVIPHEREIFQAPAEDEPEEGATVTSSPDTEPIAEPAPPESHPQKLEPESLQVSPPVQGAAELPNNQNQTLEESTQATSVKEDSERGVEPTEEAEKQSEEDNEPFADILENKDKKRYSSQPLPQQSSEQTS